MKARVAVVLAITMLFCLSMLPAKADQWTYELGRSPGQFHLIGVIVISEAGAAYTDIPLKAGEGWRNVQAKDLQTDEPLRFEIQPGTNGAGPVLRVYFKNPVPEQGVVKIQIEADVLCSSVRLEGGRIVFDRATGGDITVILPAGCAVVHCSVPVTIYEKGDGRTVLKRTTDHYTQTLIKARPFEP